jgi:hypothetical protein
MPRLRADRREAGRRLGAEMVLVFPFMEGFGFGPGSLRRRKPDQREAHHTPKHQPFLGLAFCRPACG